MPPLTYLRLRQVARNVCKGAKWQLTHASAIFLQGSFAGMPCIWSEQSRIFGNIAQLYRASSVPFAELRWSSCLPPLTGWLTCSLEAGKCGQYGKSATFSIVEAGFRTVAAPPPYLASWSITTSDTRSLGKCAEALRNEGWNIKFTPQCLTVHTRGRIASYAPVHKETTSLLEWKKTN